MGFIKALTQSKLGLQPKLGFVKAQWDCLVHPQVQHNNQACMFMSILQVQSEALISIPTSLYLCPEVMTIRSKSGTTSKRGVYSLCLVTLTTSGPLSSIRCTPPTHTIHTCTHIYSISQGYRHASDTVPSI